MAKLKENKGNYKRFRPCRHNCPDCGKPALEDAWPPNYFGGSGWTSADGVCRGESSGQVKCVCEKCRIWFVVLVKEQYIRTSINRTEEIINRGELVEKDDILLTPHDVSQEEYKEKHGHYQRLVYG